MPIHLSPVSRRRFLAGSAAAVAGGLSARWSWADPPRIDPHFFALISDTHVAADPKESNKGVTMAENFRRVSDEIVALEVKPAATMVNGDCAYLHGLKEDYQQFARLLEPLRKDGPPLYLSMGNHDDREKFADVLAAYRPDHPPVTGRFVSIIPGERANWFLLDSLRKTNDTPGELGSAQCDWLAKALDARAEKPAIVVCHHNPVFDAAHVNGGLIDTPALFDVLRKRKQVKALVFGHTHNWHVGEQDGIHLVNLPPTAYLFDPGRPNGWVSAQLHEDGMTLVLHPLDKNHPEGNKPRELKWRAA